MKFFAFLFAAFLLATPVADALADKGAAITYSKTNIVLLRKSAPLMPWQDKRDGALILNVEIRDGMGLYNQRGWFNLSSYEQNSGVMMAFQEAGVQPIVRSAQYAPADILFIDKQGKIIQIAPNILLSELEQDIYPAAPIMAFLFLKGGTCASLSINPGDEIEYTLFKKPPVILGAPTGDPTQNMATPSTITDIPVMKTKAPITPVLQSY